MGSLIVDICYKVANPNISCLSWEIGCWGDGNSVPSPQFFHKAKNYNF